MSKLNCHLTSHSVPPTVCIDGNQDTGCSFRLNWGGLFERTLVSGRFSVSDTDWLCGDGWECTGQNNRHCVRLRRPKEQVLSTGTGLWHQNRFRIWIWGYCALLSTCRPPGQKATQEKKKGKGKAIPLRWMHSSLHPLLKKCGRQPFYFVTEPAPSFLA